MNSSESKSEARELFKKTIDEGVLIVSIDDTYSVKSPRNIVYFILTGPDKMYVSGAIEVGTSPHAADQIVEMARQEYLKFCMQMRNDSGLILQ